MSDAERKYHTATIQGQTAANIENYAETLRIQREEGQYAMHTQTQSANLGAYQIEKLTEMVTSSELLPNTLVWKQGMAT